ncbi:MAG: Glycerol-3-phosphate dehydrogenase [Firmicutes bacterium]|nr:Glycerol-3-phosphate dehydrogenase [Bacillota bacterium]
MKVAVLGSGGWGTALAMLLLGNGHQVKLWSHTGEESKRLELTRENPLLPDITLPSGLSYTCSLDCVTDCDVIVMATPSFAVRRTARDLKGLLKAGTVIVSVSKGIEKDTSLRLSQVIREETGGEYPVAVLSGPSHAEEVARKMPTGCVSACEDRAVAEFVQDLFLNEYFRVYTSPDTIGVELGAALKNVMALCAGCCSGMGLGDNTKAMLMTRGLTEVARLGVALGGKRETFAGLAGMGDLIVTCTSLNSRNNRAGILIGGGMAPEEAVSKIGAVVEGYFAVDSARTLARRLGVEMPITEAAYRVLYEGAGMADMLKTLMLREKRHEVEESWM